MLVIDLNCDYNFTDDFGVLHLNFYPFVWIEAEEDDDDDMNWLEEDDGDDLDDLDDLLRMNWLEYSGYDTTYY
jgi:hypothetical protein